MRTQKGLALIIIASMADFRLHHRCVSSHAHSNGRDVKFNRAHVTTVILTEQTLIEFRALA